MQSKVFEILAVGVHHIDFAIVITVGNKSYLCTVGRHNGRMINIVMSFGKIHAVRAVCIHDVNVVGVTAKPAETEGKHDLCPIRRPRGGTAPSKFDEICPISVHCVDTFI